MQMRCLKTSKRERREEAPGTAVSYLSVFREETMSFSFKMLHFPSLNFSVGNDKYISTGGKKCQSLTQMQHVMPPSFHITNLLHSRTVG